MRAHSGIQLLAATLLAAFLAGCGPQVVATPPTARPIAQPGPPTAQPTAPPTPQATAPAAQPGADKLPALSSAQWRELGQGAFTDNGAPTRILYLPAELPADAAFAANYGPEQLAVAEALVIVQVYEGSELVWLQADRSGVSSDVLLWQAPEGSAPAGYMAAFDPGSSFLLSLLPLGPGGERAGAPIPINWSDAEGAFRVVRVPDAGQGPADAPAATPSGADYAEVGQAALEHLEDLGLERPAVVGATAVAGDYAAAVAGVFLEERARFLVLRRGEAGAWEVLLDTPEPTAEALAGVGAPASLAGEHALSGLHLAVIRQLQDPRGQGIAGHLEVQRIDQGYARLIFMPEDRMTRDPLTMFFGPGEGGWAYLIAGTAFMGPELDQLGVPPSVR